MSENVKGWGKCEGGYVCVCVWESELVCESDGICEGDCECEGGCERMCAGNGVQVDACGSMSGNLSECVNLMAFVRENVKVMVVVNECVRGVVSGLVVCETA